LTSKLSVNELAWKLVEEMRQKAKEYNVIVERTRLGTVLIDAGIKTDGGLLAGKMITEICMGGCGKSEITCKRYGDLEMASIFVYTDHPAVAILGAQFAGWRIKIEEFFAIGSGPARALTLKPKELYEEIGYKDECDKAVLVLETEKKPPEKVAEKLAEECGVQPENLAVILVPTTSIAGSIQISGRVVETGMHKLEKLGLNPKLIAYAWGYAPIAPSHPKFSEAMGRTNDSILYGGVTFYAVRWKDDEEKLREILGNAPSKASKSYGKPFTQIFKEANYDFYKVDPKLFAPAVIMLNNLETGNTFVAGEVNVEVLKQSWGLKP